MTRARATGLFAALRHLLLQTCPNWICENAKLWESWCETTGNTAPLPGLTPAVIAARIQCLDDIILHKGLLQLLSLGAIQPLILFVLPNPSTVEIVRGDALREGWASLVSLLTEDDLNEVIQRLPKEMLIALLPRPSAIPPGAVERLATSKSAEQLAACWGSVDQSACPVFMGQAGDYAGFDAINDLSLAQALGSIRELHDAVMPAPVDINLRHPNGDLVKTDEDRGFLVRDREVELSVGKSEMLTVIVSAPGQRERITAIRSGALLPLSGELDVPILPRHASDIEQNMRIQVWGPDGARASRETGFTVPGASIEPWMLTAFLNRGGGGNPVIRAFAAGTGSRLAYAEDEPGVLHDVPVVWGVLRGSDRILAQARSQGLHFYYIDHAYFDRGHGKSYRITRNRYEAGKVRKVADDRLGALGLDIKPWRRNGRYIIVCPPTEHFIAAHDCADWLDRTLTTLRLETDRPIIIREKPRPGETTVPLAKALRTAHALVTHSSNVAIEAACLGTPVFVSPTSAAAPVGVTDLGRIETPSYPDRHDWLAHLAYSQYSIDEIRDGTAWNLMRNLEVCDFV